MRYLFLVLTFSLLITACKNRPASKQPSEKASQEVLETLYTNYKSGEILECEYKGAWFYKCSRNAPDAGSEVFNASGKKVAGCYPSTGAGMDEALCSELEACTALYRVAKNIWGKPAVNTLDFLK